MFLGGVRPLAFQGMTNEPMLDYAKSKTDGYDGIAWRQADATTLTFSDKSFDMVFCKCGPMFVPDKLAALREVHRVLRSDGLLVLNVWDSIELNDLARIAHRTTKRLFPINPPTFYEIPFSLHNQQELDDVVRRAGIENIELTNVSKVGLSPASPAKRCRYIAGTTSSGQRASVRGVCNDRICLYRNKR
jgi:ubiquinone/menaquinone biosynthesis C-methylase UbiE